MEKVTMHFSSEEKELLDECTTILKLKRTPLLRTLMVSAFDELLKDIETNQEITLIITEQQNPERVYPVPVAMDEETQAKYEKIKSYLPVHGGNFTKILIMPKLKSIKEKKQSFGEIFT